MDYLFTNNRIKLLFNFTTNKLLYYFPSFFSLIIVFAEPQDSHLGIRVAAKKPSMPLLLGSV